MLVGVFSLFIALVYRWYFYRERHPLLTSGVKVCFLTLIPYSDLLFLYSIAPAKGPLCFLTKCLFFKLFFTNSFYMGLLETVSLWAGMPVGIRLLTARSPQTPRKRDPHWDVVLLLFVVVMKHRYTHNYLKPSLMHS